MLCHFYTYLHLVLWILSNFIRAERQTDDRKSGTVDTVYTKVKMLELICEYKLLL